MNKKLLFSLFITLISIFSKAQNDTIWGKYEYKGAPWVENISKPNIISNGLANRHIAVWASHGRYYDIEKSKWRWQRPILFSTTEDLFTPTIVVPYLLPMLQNAGAVVFTPRERDWQINEVIVDNDSPNGGYHEINGKKKWEDCSKRGFAFHEGNYQDGENPFKAGTARKAKARKRNSKLSSIVYQPTFKEAGQYAVYVSYQTHKKSIDDAEYIVFHKGEETHFKVNQKMGGGTWVYLGTFNFDAGSSMLNSVVLTNHSSHHGIVTADAVRFGGGMGNIEREGKTSGLPRCLEGARYYAQWAGAPWEIVSKSNGKNDYKDDINVRSLMTNWLAAGSSYIPGEGEKVPIDLSLAIHSDAGTAPKGNYVGSLGICTTQEGDKYIGKNLARSVSKTLAEEMIYNIKKDIDQSLHINWNTRYIYDRNYSETRLPKVPSMILETLSHQNFNDMRLGQDPNFKFIIARSIYKTILRYEAMMHNTSYTVQPLTPSLFRIKFINKKKVRLQWNIVKDPCEPTSTPTSYNIYTAVGKGDFNNGINIKNTYYDVELQPYKIYHFRITACNSGGESFPTEVLSTYYNPNADKTILIINGFNRLSSPAVIDSIDAQGFDIKADPGVTYGKTIGWSGQQTVFNTKYLGQEGANALGFGGEELVGNIIAGNDFDYVRTHAEAIASVGKYNIVSCSKRAVEKDRVRLINYDAIDFALGLEKDDGYSLLYYKTFTPEMQHQISNYLQHNGRIFVNGAYISSDMKTEEEKSWLSHNLKITFAGSNLNNSSSLINGFGKKFDIYRTINAYHYGAYSPDNIMPANNQSKPFMMYADGNYAAVAYKGNDYRTFIMAFPLDCIKDATIRNQIMKEILTYLLL